MATIDDAIEVLKTKGLVLKIVEGLQDYLSWKIKFAPDKNRAWFGQSHLTKNSKKKFGKHMQDVQSHKTPGMPKFLIVRPMVKSKKISAKDQQDYWSGVGMLLYLVNHSCPILASATKELSKANDSMNPAAYKELLQVIKYVLDMKNLGLKIEHTENSSEPRGIICFSNSNYIGDLVSRWSISGFILYVLGILVSWQSKSQKIDSLSSSEIEYIALSKAVKEVMFMIQLPASMKISFKYPVMVRVNNVGPIFMASNINTTCHTNHVENKYKYVKLLR